MIKLSKTGEVITQSHGGHTDYAHEKSGKAFKKRHLCYIYNENISFYDVMYIELS